MLNDESEPSLFRTFEENMYSASSDEEQPTNLERKSSISLYNVSSTPHLKPVKKCRFRTASQYNIDSDNQKPKRKKYDHIQSKVKQYRMEIREQTEYRRKLRQQQEQELRHELENNVKQTSILSPIVNQSNLFNEPELTEKYHQALDEIKILQSEIMELKTTTTTPKLIHKKSQSSMIKTCLFKNSSNALRQNIQNNTTNLSGVNSTCCTFDIEDLISPTTKQNPFIIKSPTPSSIVSITNSSVPLLVDFDLRPRKKKVYSFFNKFIKCPKMSFFDFKRSRRNKVEPIPHVVISSPGREKIFTDESFVFLQSSNQDLLQKEITEHIEEMIESIDRFKQLLNNYLLTTNNININNNNT